MSEATRPVQIWNRERQNQETLGLLPRPCSRCTMLPPWHHLDNFRSTAPAVTDYVERISFFFLFFFKVYSPQGYRERLENRNSGTAVWQFHKASTASQESLVQAGDQVLGCLPSPLFLSFHRLPSPTHLHAHTCSSPFQEFYYCFKIEKRKVNLNSARSSRTQEGEMRMSG